MSYSLVSISWSGQGLLEPCHVNFPD
jgi:hypothetical protein